MVRLPRRRSGGTDSVSPDQRAGAGPENDPDEKMIGWLTDFDNPTIEKARNRRLDRHLIPRTKFPITAVLTLVAGVAAAGAIIAAIEPTSSQVPDSVSTSPSQTSGPPTPTPTPEPPVVVDARIPERCSQLFGSKMKNTLGDNGLELTGRWRATTLPRTGSLDPELLDLLSTTTVMECYWLQPGDDPERGILTAIGAVDSRQARLAAARAVEMGMTKAKEVGGTRFYLMDTDATGMAQGESHFFRDGLWFATRWWGYGPYGYTADMADHIYE